MKMLLKFGYLMGVLGFLALLVGLFIAIRFVWVIKQTNKKIGVYKSTEVIENGGITIWFTAGDSSEYSQHINFHKGDKCITTQKTNYKGSFDIDKISFIEYKYIDDKSGLLTVHFKEDLKRNDLILGIVYKPHWEKFSAYTENYVKIEEVLLPGEVEG